MSAVSDLARGIVMAGITGTRFDPSLPRFGGYALFPREGTPLADVRSLADVLRAGDDPPPIIAIDQEGGTVARLRDGVEAMPSAMSLGAADEIDLVQRAGEQVAFDLRRAGCTLDFSPVLDLALDPQNTVIGSRSFGSDPHKVSCLGTTFACAMRRGGILPCYKHFPGHGATAVDSHEALPSIGVDEATLRARDMLPFATVAPHAPAMMTAHVVLMALDRARPATFSKVVISELLRRELGFRGTLVTDCLEMQAAAHREHGAVDALAAGADLLLFSHDLTAAAAAVDAVERAVKADRIPLSRLQDAHARVLELRRAGSPPLPIDAFPPHPMVGREIARRAITLVRGVPRADPVASIAISFGGEKPVLKAEAPALEEISASFDPSADELRSLLECLASHQRRPLLLARRAHCHNAQALAIARIVDRFPDALVVSLREPFDVPLFGAARHVVAAYGDDEVSIGGLADVIFGGSMPSGSLPVSLAA